MLQLYTKLMEACSSWIDSFAPEKSYFTEPFDLPLAVEAGEAGLAGKELLHGGLFEVALLGDEPVQRGQQSIRIAQRLCDGTLFRNRWDLEFQAGKGALVEVNHCRSDGCILNGRNDLRA